MCSPSTADDNHDDNTHPDDCLLLVLAHFPLPSAALAALVDRTAATVHQTTTDLARGSTQRLLVTGSPHLPRPGLQLEHWDTQQQWSVSDAVMASVIRAIGLERFHTKTSGVRLQGHLIDMEIDHKQCSENDNSGNHQRPSDERYDDHRLRHLLATAARRVEHYLNLRYARDLTRATVLVPAMKGATTADTETMESLVLNVLRELWNRDDGPLRNVPLTVEVVGGGGERS